MEYSPYMEVVEQTLVATLKIGTNVRPQVVNNMVEFQTEALRLCGLSGDGIVYAYVGDTLLFYKKTYIFRQYGKQLRLN